MRTLATEDPLGWSDAGTVDGNPERATVERLGVEHVAEVALTGHVRGDVMNTSIGVDPVQSGGEIHAEDVTPTCNERLGGRAP
jgi:hypothetical protein